MGIDVVLTKHIQNAIVLAIKREQVPDDLAKRLSEYTEKCLDQNGLDSAKIKVAVPFQLVKQLWECLRENGTG